ncbi:DUF2790 domain-containing protein [Pseudomonas japonica]|uniref:DUF2790 domain-containing protein n=1 Tax=Pseudomonas japonica TaxID=256466 RepID=A0A239ES21_9PSED|nr:DUF2790 domain-containing protein [Pseudomonas japonica]SNS46833.1 Protein of unknown function [Pseudomonas japonica]
MKVRVMLLPVLLLSAAAQAAQTPTPVDYRYGMPLDIAKVLDLREPAGDQQCKVVQATMTYLDSHGQEHALRYLKLAEECSDQG